MTIEPGSNVLENAIVSGALGAISGRPPPSITATGGRTGATPRNDGLALSCAPSPHMPHWLKLCAEAGALSAPHRTANATATRHVISRSSLALSFDLALQFVCCTDCTVNESKQTLVEKRITTVGCVTPAPA